MDDQIKALLRQIVDVLHKVNDQAQSSFLYAKEIDLALRKLPEMPEFSSRFRKALNDIHDERDKAIPDIAFYKQRYTESQRSLARIAELLR